VAFSTGNGQLECEECAKRHGLIARGQMVAALDMLVAAVTCARGSGATPDEVRRAVEGHIGDSCCGFDGGWDAVECFPNHDPREWQRGYTALTTGGQ